MSYNYMIINMLNLNKLLISTDLSFKLKLKNVASF